MTDEKTALIKQSRRIAVIGAGIAGVICARHLVDAAHEVQCFDKSGGAGGRLANRRIDWVNVEGAWTSTQVLASVILESAHGRA